MPQHHVKAVFIADDDEDDRFLLKTAFNKCCPETRVEFAIDGIDLMESLDKSPLHPCLIILDLNMPRLDGFESLKILRSSEAYRDVPIVVFSTSEENNDIAKAKKMGANDYKSKPLNMNSLNSLVEQLKKDWDLTTCY